jgi:hypothetical protein
MSTFASLEINQEEKHVCSGTYRRSVIVHRPCHPSRTLAGKMRKLSETTQYKQWLNNTLSLK